MANFEAYLDDFGKVNVVVPKYYYDGKISFFYLTGGPIVDGSCMIRRAEERNGFMHYELTILSDIGFGQAYEIVEEHGSRAPLKYRHIVSTQGFEERFTYTKDDLGSRYYPDHTDFAVWAPTAINVVLRLCLKDKVTLYAMKRTDKGVFRISVEGDLEKATYTYVIEHCGEIVETVDPYALSATTNLKTSAVINEERITSIPDKAVLTPLRSPCDAIIYECNVRDMTSNKDTGTLTNGTYEAFYEKGTSYEGMPTGLDYLSSLGITHVQLQPVIDFETVDENNPKKNYNWGYDPTHVCVLDGSYSSDPSDPYARMKEFKQLVSTLHERGIRVVLDIVWNHMYQVKGNALDSCVPYYYFRYNESGYLSNGSYCGNDMASQRSMMRHLFLYATRKLVTLYGIDGFRFDLMGILDVDTMNMIEKQLHALKPDALIYGEGWDMPTFLDDEDKAKIYNQGKMPRIGHFNDTFRDVLKGKTSDSEKYDRGYFTGNIPEAFDACGALLGNSVGSPFFKRFEAPTQSINALETHDNATLWDKMHACCGDENRETRCKRVRMLILATLVAQGVPFLHAQMEFGGTKQDNSNSYNAGDVINGMNWKRMVLNKALLDYTKKAIALRRNEERFRFASEEEIRKNVNISNDHGIIFYDIKGNKEKKDLRILMNATYDPRDYHFTEGYKIIFDENGSAHEEVLHHIHIEAQTCLVLKRVE